MKPRLITLLDFFSSLKLTLTCIAAAFILVLAGTLAQVNLGIDIVQERYFRSFFVWWPGEGNGLQIPVFPGGHLIGAFLLLNLIVGFYRRFHWAWNKGGILLTHAGLIVMLIGGLFTDLLSSESHMRIEEGQSKNYSEDFRLMELALLCRDPNGGTQITTIPESLLSKEGTIDHPSLPFLLTVKKFFKNSQIQNINPPLLQAAASQGVGSRVAVMETSRATAMNQQDVESAIIEIIPRIKAPTSSPSSLGTWLVSEAIEDPQNFQINGQQHQMVLRPLRYYKPFSLTLHKFTHDRYPGTEVAKNFASRLTLDDPEHQERREVLIYMNHPLRYRGDTFYQSGFDKNNPKVTVLQVVHNPSFITPYVACIIVGIGLLYQFTYHFAGFLKRRKSESVS